MNIDLTKQYSSAYSKQYTTRSGLPVKLYDIVTDTNQTYPIIGAVFDKHDNLWRPNSWKIDGSCCNLDNHPFDLIEKPTHNFVKDQLVPVWDKDKDSGFKKIRFYSHYDSNNNLHCIFTDGMNSKDAESVSYPTTGFKHCEPYYPTYEHKPLEEGELVVVWDDCDDDELLDKYYIRTFHSKSKVYYVTNRDYSNDGTLRNWNNCVRLSEFKL